MHLYSCATLGTYVGEVILGQHRVSRVISVVIVEHDMLLLLTALDNLIRAGSKFIADLVNQGHNERRNDGKNEDRQLLFKLLNDLWKNRNLLHCRVDGLNNVIVKLDGGHDLVVAVLDVHGELLGVTRRHGSVLHLSSIGVRLNFINLLTVVLVAKDATGNLVQELTQQAGVSVLAVLKCTLKFINFILSQLIRD